MKYHLVLQYVLTKVSGLLNFLASIMKYIMETSLDFQLALKGI